jgi:phenylalanyl-tRNA synthetase beta subunit
MHHKARKLTDDEVKTLISIITKQLKKQAGAVIRG